MSKQQPADTFKYDAAISFLNEDLAIAKELHDGVGSSLSVFLYTERQQEIAGSDGLETFRSAFRKDSRLVVVLFRAGWGATNWTAVEQEAIGERFFKEGPAFLLFVMLDDSPPPLWLPDTRIRFNLAQFGMAQAIGAIKFRLQELGATLRAETPAQRAIRSAERYSEFNRETKRLWHCDEGVTQATSAASHLIDIIESEFMSTSDAAPNLQMKFARDGTSIAAKTLRPSISVYWKNNIINSLEGARVVVCLFGSRIILPGEKLIYVMRRPPEPISQYEFVPERVRGSGWNWKSQDDDKVKTSVELANFVLNVLLNTVEAPE